MVKGRAFSRSFLSLFVFLLSLVAASSSSAEKGRGRSGLHGQSPEKQRLRREAAMIPVPKPQKDPLGKLAPAIPISAGALGRSTVVINDQCQIVFTRTCPTGAVGCSQPACDPDLVGSPPTFTPGSFLNCEPLRLVVRNFDATETVVATEGEDLGGGLRLAAWGEFYDMNSAGCVAFKAMISGRALVDETVENESGVGLFLAGPGAPLARLVTTGDVVGGRRICGIAPMISMNDARQIAFEGYSARVTPPGPCGTSRGVFRFTPGTGTELLMANGTDVGGGVTVVRFDPDPQDDGDTLDLNINSLGQVVVAVRLSDGDDAIYRLNAPGSFTEIARSGNAGPGGIFDRVAARPDLNNAGQVLFKVAIGGDGSPATHNDGVDSLILFTPPSTYQVIAQSGGAIPGLPGQTFQGFAAFFDLNNNGDAVFKADVVVTPAVAGTNERSSPCPPPAPPPAPAPPPPGRGGCGVAGLYLWNRSTTTVTEIVRTAPLPSQFHGLYPTILTLNDARRVVFGTRPTVTVPSTELSMVQRGLFSWTAPGPPVKLLEIGDTLDGNPVSTIFSQHLPFERQLAENGSFASAAYISGQNPDDAPMGERGHNGKLFAVFSGCAGVSACAVLQQPTPTPTPTGTITPPGPTPTSTPIPGAPPSDIPTLTPWLLVLFGLALVTVAFFVIRRF